MCDVCGINVKFENGRINKACKEQLEWHWYELKMLYSESSSIDSPSSSENDEFSMSSGMKLTISLSFSLYFLHCSANIYA